MRSKDTDYIDASDWVVDDRLFLEETEEGVIEKTSKELGDRFRNLLKKEYPSVVDRICFLDVLMSLPSGSNRGFLLLPHESNVDVITGDHPYTQVVKELIGERMSIGDHPVFLAGLPVYVKGAEAIRPETEEQLREVFGIAKPSEIKATIFMRKLNGVESSGDLEAEPKEKRKLRASSLVYSRRAGERVRRRNRSGGSGQSVLENIDWFVKQLGERRHEVCDEKGRALSVIYGVPVVSLLYEQGNLGMEIKALNQGCCFLGLSGAEDSDHKLVVRLKDKVSDTVGAAGRHSLDKMVGASSQRTSFAHQTSAVVDSIIQNMEGLPAEVRAGMGSRIAPNLYILRAVINSYRGQGGRFDSGEFKYNWSEQSPLEVYRDIGIQLGFSRAEYVERGEERVRDQAYNALRSDNDIGSKGFERYRTTYFEAIPEVHPSLEKQLRHSSFAVLIMLVIKQAFYHTLLAHRRSVTSRIRIDVSRGEDGMIFECAVSNPDKGDGAGKRSKDERELGELAERFSMAPSHQVRYEVEGPFYAEEQGIWKTVTRVYERSIEDEI